AAWCTVSYVPFVWHPMVRVSDPGEVDWFVPGEVVDGDSFRSENQQLRARGGRVAQGTPANPVVLAGAHHGPRARVGGRARGPPATAVSLRAPHRVRRALVTGFTTAPLRPDEPWLHQSL